MAPSSSSRRRSESAPPTGPRTTQRTRHTGTSPRGWLTLIVLAFAAAVVSIGPDTLVELIRGVILVRPPAASIDTPPVRADDTLQRQLVSVAGSLSRGHLAAMAVDLGSGASASVDADRAYPAASLFKLPILLEVLAREDAGTLDPEQLVPIRAEDWADGSGVLQARIGDELSIRQLSRLMIQDSDNIASLALLDVVGVASANAMAARLGLASTRLVDHRAGELGDHVTSAADMARVLLDLASGQAVNQRVSEAALRLLELEQSVSWVRDDLPFWVKVAHKWGDLPEARNDAAIVFTPRGNYVITVLTENSPPEEAAAAIARASRLTYDYLGNRR